MLDGAEAFRRFPDPFRGCKLWRVFLFQRLIFALPADPYFDQRD